MTSTPPLLSVTEPPTPLYGSRFDDLPIQTVRRSPRISKQRHTRTPSPNAKSTSHHNVANSSPQLKNRTRRAPNYSSPHSPLSSPTMPQGKGHNINARGSKQTDSEQSKTHSADPSTLMLPTPVKTPRKKEVTQTVASTARVLFPHRPETVEEVMPTPRKRSKKGLSLESFTANEASVPEIKIFTDSKDKIPEIDKSVDNPFYAQDGSSSHGHVKTRKRTDHNKEVQDALEHDEGMVYVFRGKKIYRKFAPEDYTEPEGGEGSAAGLPLDELHSPKPFTRSSVKPRFLFGRKPSPAESEDDAIADDEAPTDIEDIDATAGPPNEVGTPTETSFAVPATPPQTNRSKRVAFHDPAGEDDLDAVTPDDPRFTVKKARRASPFDGWQRTKTGAALGGAKGKKRVADNLERSTDNKRIKGSDMS